jgi:hypothetical protein
MDVGRIVDDVKCEHKNIIISRTVTEEFFIPFGFYGKDFKDYNLIDYLVYFLNNEIYVCKDCHKVLKTNVYKQKKA